ncbi:MAG: hypothetical protein ABI806_01460 [Candidatus Solibacter sp.]
MNNNLKKEATTDNAALPEARKLWKYLGGVSLPVFLTFPLMYACAIPLVLLDLVVLMYQAICFPVYGIPKVRRREYLIFDRGRLQYLNVVEKGGCVYCSYANGVLAYIGEIVARTEQHFCPIKHATSEARPHSRYSHFLPYGDAAAYRTRANKVRHEFTDIKPAPGRGPENSAK